MPKLKSGTILHTPAEDAAITAAAMFKPLVRRGRPLGSGSKTQVTLRLDVEVIQKFKASGDGWQTRINDALKSWVQSHA
jgi:uncharacterized protein (DUF4415 family)